MWHGSHMAEISSQSTLLAFETVWNGLEQWWIVKDSCTETMWSLETFIILSKISEKVQTERGFMSRKMSLIDMGTVQNIDFQVKTVSWPKNQ